MFLCLLAYMLIKSKCMKTDFYYRCPQTKFVYGLIPLPQKQIHLFIYSFTLTNFCSFLIFLP